MRKVICLMAIVFALTNFIPTASMWSYGVEIAPPEIAAESAILMDMHTGNMVFEKNADVPMFPASTTKMMTAILAVEHLDLSQNITIDKETPFTEGARIYLEEGEVVTGEQLLRSMLIASANDSAVALAKAVAGDVPSFAKMMNERAKKLGAKNTNFVNPNGLHEEAHVTTARDLALIGQKLMSNDLLREIVGTYRYVFPATNKKEERFLYNTNRLLYDDKTTVTVNGKTRSTLYEGAMGVKTGYTPEAKSCLVSAAKRGNTELLAVVLKSSDGGRFEDSIALLDYGFHLVKSVKVMSKGTDLGEAKVKGGSVNRVKVIAAKDAVATLPKEASTDMVKTKVVFNKDIQAPIKENQKLGEVRIYEGDKRIGTVDALAVSAVPKGGILSVFGIPDKNAKIIGIVVASLLGIFVVLLVAYILLKRRQIRRKKKRKAEKAKREKRAQEHAWKEWSGEYDKRKKL
ncbi:MAG: D-alanyl-D-alanine carboxypeptidase family protein [Anaerovorax sp.]